MVSPALVKLSSPVARSFLIAIGVALVVSVGHECKAVVAVCVTVPSGHLKEPLSANQASAVIRNRSASNQVDALLTFFAASQYPYLIAYTDQLYIENSRTISFVYSALGIAALLLTITTAVASIKSATNFVLVVSTDTLHWRADVLASPLIFCQTNIPNDLGAHL